MREKKSYSRIGMLDWGIGGLGVYKEFQKRFNYFQCLYVSDSGFTPYGKVPSKKLIKRLNQITSFFRQNNIDTVVIACNAASTVKDDLQKRNPDIKFWGMLDAGKDIIQENQIKNILVLGGQRTIDSRYFQNEFKNSSYQVQSLVAQPLSALIEQGLHFTPKFSKVVSQLVKQSFPAPDAVLLACTHYPAAHSVFREKFKGALILDPAKSLIKNFEKSKWLDKKGTSLFITTGDAKESQLAAEKSFGLKNIQFTKVQIR